MKSLSRIDQHLLSEVLAVQTESYDDELMHNYILNALKFLNVTVKEDKYGNIYVTKGKAKYYPLVAAHIDTVHSVLDDISIHRVGDTIFAFDPKDRRQTGIGGDDKVGVYMLLQAIADVPVIKAVFFRNEETGAEGSKYSIENHKSWYDDCAYAIQADRRGNTDFITIMNGTTVCSEDFFSSVSKYTSKYKYKKARGVNTDVLALSRGGIGISVCNISCGYYNPHTDNEIVSIADVNTAYNLMYDIVMSVTGERFEHIPTTPVYKTKGSSQRPFGLPRSVPYHKQMTMFGQATNSVPLSNYATRQEFRKFKHDTTTSSGTRVFLYTGIDSLPLIGDPGCPECGEKDSLLYLPYEGRLYCTAPSHNNYVDDDATLKLIKFLEVDDGDVTFVFSVYSRGWIIKDDAIWSIQFDAWVPDDLPWNK